MTRVFGLARPSTWALNGRSLQTSATGLALGRQGVRAGGGRIGWRALVASLGLAVLALSTLAAGPSLADYKLGAQDRLRIKVFEWRPSRGEVFEWTALNDEFTVNTAGTISLPLVGDLAAEGLGTDELARSIVDRLQAKVGLVQRPDASVEIVQFRPFYIVGQVEKPGEYPYRPALTVLQAISIAGGLPRLTDVGLMRLERESIATRGALKILDLEESGLHARLARLRAELAGAESIDYPPQLTVKRNEPGIGQLLQQEQSIFDTRRDGLRTQIESLNQLKTFLDKEVESLKGQVETEDRQLGLVRRELQSVGTLVDKGLAIAPRQLSLERTVAQIEGDRLRVATQLLRAKQDISKTELTILELRNKFHNDIVFDIQQSQAKLNETVEQARTQESLAYESEVKAPEFIAQRTRDQKIQPIYTVVRRIGDRNIEMTVVDTAFIEPGDTIKVELPRSDRTQMPVSVPPSPANGPQSQAPDVKRLSLGRSGSAEN